MSEPQTQSHPNSKTAVERNPRDHPPTAPERIALGMAHRRVLAERIFYRPWNCQCSRITPRWRLRRARPRICTGPAPIRAGAGIGAAGSRRRNFRREVGPVPACGCSLLTLAARRADGRSDAGKTRGPDGPGPDNLVPGPGKRGEKVRFRGEDLTVRVSSGNMVEH